MRGDAGMDKRFSTIPDPLRKKLQLLIPPEPPKPKVDDLGSTTAWS